VGVDILMDGRGHPIRIASPQGENLTNILWGFSVKEKGQVLPFLQLHGGLLGLFNTMTNAVLLLGAVAPVGRHFCHELSQTEVSQGTGVPLVVRVDDPPLHLAGISVC
jgi:hypothetical protein